MPRPRLPSPQASKVLIALAEQPAEWRYGYELGAEVDIKSGSLYPILMRLADRGLLAASWEDNPPQGRPARHLYRLTSQGLSLAAEVQLAAAESATARRQARVRLGGAS